MAKEEVEIQAEIEGLKQRLKCLEAKLVSNDPDGDIVPGQILTPTQHDYHLSLILLLNEPPGTSTFLDEVIDADSMQQAKERLTQLKTRKTRYKRKAMILQAAETWKNYT